MKFWDMGDNAVNAFVAPLAGAWIEIFIRSEASTNHPSLPSRERGLKLPLEQICPIIQPVAPLAGAWIEIAKGGGISEEQIVAPLAGAWIEIRLL